MPVIREKDLSQGKNAWAQWREAAYALANRLVPDIITHNNVSQNDAVQDNATQRNALQHTALTTLSPELPHSTWAMAVRYTLFLLECKAPGPGVEVRVAPWGAVKILDGPASDPHNLTPPDVIELDPDVWLRLAAGITTWAQEKNVGHISAVGERDDLSALLPL